MSRLLWRLRARLGYWLARRLFHWPWVMRQPRAWQWMQGQYGRMANLGDTSAQSFYGHILLFRGQGLGAREEGLRLLRLAAAGGDGKAAYQLGVQALQGNTRQAPDGQEAVRYWTQALAAGHPLAASRLSQLYRDGAPGVAADPTVAERYAAQADDVSRSGH
ncbi:sel1 repeat family protein [Pseudomonas berkeleyensis]|uniref:Sel1 repeat family protein n=1 Tax=Pseudomonas berkeleyensis TaxID=2726956 RepID=A0A7G5DT48_9PSED|nr:sel1 repeat family protein [Pseudomonas berkeleyensis]QMV64923.1 sel1 repeat family protein [Pseudomonas berkeleyensis]WSO40390.1 sel1 repeat family protein [Pseudomonas berkeleyensis]